MNRVLLLCLLCLLGFGALGTAWASPEISGGSRFKFGAGNANVTLSADAIINSNEDNSTGTIKVQLWALDAPYRANAGGLRGHLLGGFTLEPLYAGNVYNNVSRSVKVSPPPRRADYFLALVISEYRGSGYVISDVRNFDNPVQLSPAQLFTMRGPWYWEADEDEGTLNMQVKYIGHTRAVQTGSLRLSVWATRRPFAGGTIRGHELGRVDKKPLTKGFVYNDLDNTVALQPPPPGDYHISLLLSEFDGERYVLRAYLLADEMYSFE